LSITYVLLSPTFGMHQYTADLANRAADFGFRIPNSEPGYSQTEFRNPAVHLVTSTSMPRDRYSQAVMIHAPVTTHGTGFSREGLSVTAYQHVLSAICNLLPKGTICHFTGVHAWNVPLVYTLRRRGIPVIHTLHDLDPHRGVRFGPLIRLWNRLIIGSGCHLLVHGRRYRDALLAQGVPAARITCTPLLHGFLGAQRPWPPAAVGTSDAARFQAEADASDPDLKHNPNPEPGLSLATTVLFFGRVEAYKGVEDLLAAWKPATVNLPRARLIIAGPVAQNMRLPPLPPGVEMRDRRVLDEEADALFRSASLLVLPYRDATQSALVAAAYAFGVPAVVTDAGALPEYVVPGGTGWVVPAGDVAALAAALRQALVDPARLRQMGEAGREWFARERQAEQATLTALWRLSGTI
jgi:glycosyltransferase involved in cell wall biosynthesis